MTGSHFLLLRLDLISHLKRTKQDNIYLSHNHYYINEHQGCTVSILSDWSL